MPTFTYKARAKSGLISTGEVIAGNKSAATAELIRRGLVPTQMEEKKAVAKGDVDIFARFEKVSIGDLILFTSQLATLFRAGIPLVECFSGLIEQAESKKFKKTLTEIQRMVTDGAALNEAMARYRDVFSETYINMIMAGEVSGTLDESLRRLTRMLEQQFATENKIKEVLRYPKIVTSAIAVAVGVLMTFVVPRFMGIFEKAKLQLPLPTRILIFLNHIFQQYWWLGLIIVVVVVFLFRRYIATAIGRYQWHRFTVTSPIFGDIMLKLTMAQFCTVLSNLIKSGVPILMAIEVAARTAGNDFLNRIFTQVRESVREGSGMAEPLRQHKIVPPIVVQMVSAGEGSGQLDEMLMKVADYFNDEADRKISQLSSLIEPIMIFTLGGIVLFIALAIFLPMWDMTKMARGG